MANPVIQALADMQGRPTLYSTSHVWLEATNPWPTLSYRPWQTCRVGLLYTKCTCTVVTFILITSVADPGSGFWCLFDPGIRDPGW